MRRRLLPCFIAAVLVTLAGCESVRDLPPEQQQFQNVHDSALTKDVLYVKTLEWFAKTFRDSKSVLEVQDKESGLIMGKGIIDDGVTISGPIPAKHPLKMTIKVEVKDQKFRCTYSDFIMIVPAGGLYPSGERDVTPGTELDTSKETAKRIDGELANAIEKSAADKF